jgi:hypothetical protein
MTMVNFREYYEKDGKTLPGKSGINLPIEQFKTFLSALPQLLDVLEEKGVEIERPRFGGRGGAAEDEEDKSTKQKKPKKLNIEATSDEDEED